MDEYHLNSQLEELQLIQCSLLPDETLVFSDRAGAWQEALASYGEDSMAQIPDLKGPPTFIIRLNSAKVWFEITFSSNGGPSRWNEAKPLVSVKGEDLSRNEQEKWQASIRQKLEEISGSEFPIYQLVSLHLLPLLHEELANRVSNVDASGHELSMKTPQSTPGEIYHALFTSHHLISSNKRRSLQQWAISLSVSGFAKVGYPGVIYAQGERSNVEEFVCNVKAMQWLALKSRFLEPLPAPKGGVDVSNKVEKAEEKRWAEFQKIGEVVEEMKRLGRDECVIEMGIGSNATGISK